MRLYLSSFRLGNRADLLVDLVRRSGSHASVGVIANSIDEGDPARRAAGVELELSALTELGLLAHEIDLRGHVGDPAGLQGRLSACGALWVRGGNVFTLRYAMAISGADQIIPRLLEDDTLVYAGYSAGPCVLAPSLRGLEVVDDPVAVQRAYGAEPRWDGLGVLDRPFIPHLDSPGHPETELCGSEAARCRDQGIDYWGLRDGQVLLVDGGLDSAVVV